MTLKRIEIKGFRGFEEEGIINLAIPNGKPGSGLTILVGPNNSGKSTIIEAFSAISYAFSESFKQPSFTEEMRNKKDDRILIKVIDQYDGGLEISNDSSFKSETRIQARGTFNRKEGNIFVLHSRRAFESYYEGNPFELHHRDNYIDKMEFSPRRGGRVPYFFSRISGACSGANHRRENFERVLGQILDPLPEWEIDRNGSGQYYMKFTSDGISHISDGSGDGLLSIFFIVDSLYDSERNGIIVIDEPELSLHPSLQKKLARLFADYAKNRQIIIATHSPYFIDWEAIINGANIIRVVKEGRRTAVYPKDKISEKIRKKLNNFMNDTHNPHILGLDAREAFFLDDKILLVEGQEDVIYYNKVLAELEKKLSADFYGWGVGGAEKMDVIACLLHELGFKKIIGILDNDKEQNKVKLQAAFPEYKFLCIPAEDIRTKDERTTKAKRGLLDDKYRIREEYRKDTERLFGEIESFLNR
jgi:predicted ATP-dependent endonuclease of OLD family